MLSRQRVAFGDDAAKSSHVLLMFHHVCMMLLLHGGGVYSSPAKCVETAIVRHVTDETALVGRPFSGLLGTGVCLVMP
jgi:hypothetical protein